jgi:hypothetical protein
LTASAACTRRKWTGTTRHAALGDPVGQQRGLGAVVDHQPVPDLVGQPQRGGDVVGAVAVLADHRRGAEPGGRELLALAVDPLGVLAERGLEAARSAQHHLVHGAAGAAHRRRLAADRVARARVDVDGQHPACDRVLEAEVLGVDGVQRPHGLR